MSDYNDTCLDIELLNVDTKQTLNFFKLKKNMGKMININYVLNCFDTRIQFSYPLLFLY